MSIEISPLTVLATVSLLLMVTFTIGIGYLTTVEWRDRRRRERESGNR